MTDEGSAETNFTAPEPLAANHDLDAFECGVVSLDEWLKRRARRNEAGGASRTFVVCTDKSRVVGYYSSAACSILHSLATSKIRRNMPDPIPALLLGRLAVDRLHGRGLGTDLLRDAVVRALGAAETVGLRALLAHAISAEVKAFMKGTDSVLPRSGR